MERIGKASALLPTGACRALGLLRYRTLAYSVRNGRWYAKAWQSCEEALNEYKKIKADTFWRRVVLVERDDADVEWYVLADHLNDA